MIRATRHPATIDDLYRVPDDGRRYELTRGNLIAEPPPGGRHGMVVTNIAQSLKDYADRTGRGVVLTGDAGFILARHPDTVRGPDVAWVHRERYLALRDDRGFLPLYPDLAVEVRSPSDRPDAAHDKLRDYLAAGTRRVWWADPAARVLTVHAAGVPAQTLTASMLLTDPDLLPDFETRVATLFRSPFD